MNTLRSVVKQTLYWQVINPVNRFRSYLRSFRYADPKTTENAIGDISLKWRRRIDDVIACADNQYIIRVPNAGELHNGLITMHNGIRVGGLSYYGSGNMNMLIENLGVHEPQEERAFGAVLPHVPDGSTMLELGAYWGFYSLWFAKAVANARCYLVEPKLDNLRSGRMTFTLNACRAVFEQAYVGAVDKTSRYGIPTISVDALCRTKGITRLAILHADVQRAETAMLRGAGQMLESKAIYFLFISTHSNELHYECIDLLKSRDYVIMASADRNETYSVDGLVVAKCKNIQQPKQLSISKRPRVNTAGSTGA